MNIKPINTIIDVNDCKFTKNIIKGKEEKNTPLLLTAYIEDDSVDEHITINICPDPEVLDGGFDIWIDYDLYHAELLMKRLKFLIDNRKKFIEKDIKKLE